MKSNDILIRNATIVNEGLQFKGYVLVSGPFIKEVGEGEISARRL